MEPIIVEDNSRSCEIIDPYTGSRLVWSDTHFDDETEDRLTRSLDDFCASTEDGYFEQSMSASVGETESRSRRANQQQLSKNGTANAASDAEEKDHAAILKTKFLSAFTNVKNGWVVKSMASFSCDTTTWLLGVSYKFTKLDFEEKSRIGGSVTAFEKFKFDFRSRIWLTYRKDFPKLHGSQLTNDIGWGCMMRSGQMLLAQAFLMHFLGRGWMWRKDMDKNEVETHRRIIRYFGDTLHQRSPFSLQTLVGIGRKLGRNPGDWYGPASISAVLRDALQQTDTELLAELKDICIYTAMDGVLFKQDILDLCTKSPAETNSTPHTTQNDRSLSDSDGNRTTWRSVIILIPLRLGGESLNRIYIPCLQTILCHPLSIGIIGGRPKHSMYFIGFQDDKLILLDPHCSQDCVDVLKNDFPVESFHCSFPRKLSFVKMDPTCTLGFYCRGKEDFDNFLLEVPKITKPPTQESFPLFHIENSSRVEFENFCQNASSARSSQSLLLRSQSDQGSVSCDDFALL